MTTDARELRVRRYLVGGGDLFLLSVPDGDAFQYVVVDCGMGGSVDPVLLRSCVTDLEAQLDSTVAALLVVTRTRGGFSRTSPLRELVATIKTVWSPDDATDLPSQLAHVLGKETAMSPDGALSLFPASRVSVARYPQRRLFGNQTPAVYEERLQRAIPKLVETNRRLIVRFLWNGRALTFGAPMSGLDLVEARTEKYPHWNDHFFAGPSPAETQLGAPSSMRRFHAICLVEQRVLLENATLAEVVKAVQRHPKPHRAHYVDASIRIASLLSVNAFGEEDTFDVFCPECDRRLFSDLDSVRAFEQAVLHNDDPDTVDHHAHLVQVV